MEPAKETQTTESTAELATGLGTNLETGLATNLETSAATDLTVEAEQAETVPSEPVSALQQTEMVSSEPVSALQQAEMVSSEPVSALQQTETIPSEAKKELLTENTEENPLTEENEDALEEIDLEAQEEEAYFPEDTTQKLTRRLIQGVDTLEGLLRIKFAPNQKIGSVYVAFCPSFTKVPVVKCETVDGLAEVVLPLTVLPHGMQLTVSRQDASTANSVVFGIQVSEEEISSQDCL